MTEDPNNLEQSSDGRPSVWERVYAVLLCFYPRSYRRRFGRGMRHGFARDLEQARGGGLVRVVSYCLRSFLHVFGLGLLERGVSLRSVVNPAGSPPGNADRARPSSVFGGKGAPAVDTLLTDLRLAVRRLVKSPHFTLVTLLTLALGIGATSAIFSVVHSVLLSPLPFEDSDELVFAWETRQEGSRISPVSPLNLREWRGAADGLEDLAGARPWPYNVTGGDLPERVTGAQVSPGLFSLLRAPPVVGREFSSDEEGPGGEKVCLVSHEFWLSRLEGRRDLGALRLTLNGETHAVVGVLPEGLAIPGLGSRPILTPLPLYPGSPGFEGNHNVVVYGRLKGGVPLDRVSRELESIAAGLRRTYPEWNDGIGARLMPALDQVVQGARGILWTLLGSVTLVLFIACANIAGLLLARGVEAEREMAVRMALGAGRGRILRFVLAEALVLGVAGGLLGLLVCYSGIDLIQRWAPGNLPRLGEVSVSLPVLGFALATSLGTGLLFGLIPALRAARVESQDALGEGGRAVGLGRRHRAQRLLVVGEVAMAVVLLVGSGLLVRTFRNLMSVDLGFDLDGRVAFQLSLPQSFYPDREGVTVFLDRLHERLDAIPGIQSSGSSVGLPLQPSVWRQLMTLEAHPARTLPEVPVVDVSIITSGWLETLEISPVRGRTLLESDDEDAPLVAMVNESFVQTHLPHQDPLGQRLRLGAPDHLLPQVRGPDVPWYTIVGVVEDVRRGSLAGQVQPEVIVNQRQHWGLALEFFSVVRTALPLKAVAGPIRQAVLGVDPNQSVAWVRTMDTVYSNLLAQPRFNALLVGGFGLTALLLSVIGIYGLMANAVRTRTREMGLRMALGARPGSVMMQVVRQGVLASGIGIVIGLALSPVLARFMGGLLFGVEPMDPTTYLLVVLVVFWVGVVAAILPSRRAVRLDPSVALRED